MAGIQKNNGYIFPKWLPQKISASRIRSSMDKKDALKCFRNSSSGFIKKNDLRVYLFEKFKNKCVKCSSMDKIQIDHIISVKRCFDNQLFDFCNTEENLQVLCMKCNTTKLP